MFKRTLIAALFVVPAIGFAADNPTPANSAPKHDRAGFFKKVDTNGDGMISKAEAEKNAPRLAKRFDKIDTNKDGQLSKDELRAYFESKRNRKS